jgi:quercetin dioxygenase-like cupin family protein
MKGFVTVFTLPLCAIFLSACSPPTTGGDKAAAPSLPDALSADPGHYSVLFENDAVRYLRIKYPAGAKSVMHTHPATCAVFLTDGKSKMTLPSGEVQPFDNQVGQVTCGDAAAHLPENSGDKEWELVLLEFKNRKTFDNIQTGKSISIPSMPNVPDAATADPAHYAVQFENDAVRVLRIKLEPGAKTKMHAHPANCVVELTTGTTKDGAGKPTESKAGEASCGDALSHAPENVGKTLAETIVFEFKNRQAFKS